MGTASITYGYSLYHIWLPDGGGGGQLDRGEQLRLEHVEVQEAQEHLQHRAPRTIGQLHAQRAVVHARGIAYGP